MITISSNCCKNIRKVAKVTGTLFAGVRDDEQHPADEDPAGEDLPEHGRRQAGGGRSRHPHPAPVHPHQGPRPPRPPVLAKVLLFETLISLLFNVNCYNEI